MSTPSPGAMRAAKDLYPSGVGTYCYPTQERIDAARLRDWTHIAEIIDREMEAASPTMRVGPIPDFTEAQLVELRETAGVNPTVRKLADELLCTRADRDFLQRYRDEAAVELKSLRADLAGMVRPGAVYHLYEMNSLEGFTFDRAWASAWCNLGKDRHFALAAEIVEVVQS